MLEPDALDRYVHPDCPLSEVAASWFSADADVRSMTPVDWSEFHDQIALALFLHCFRSTIVGICLAPITRLIGASLGREGAHRPRDAGRCRSTSRWYCSVIPCSCAPPARLALFSAAPGAIA
jgi:hypothetical protein